MHVMHQSTAVAALLVVSACAARSGGDSWLRGRSEENCARAACLFAVLVDATGQPIEGADVSLKGTTRGAVTNAYGRLAVQGIPSGEHPLTVTIGGRTLESEPIEVPPTYVAVTITVGPDRLTVR